MLPRSGQGCFFLGPLSCESGEAGDQWGGGGCPVDPKYAESSREVARSVCPFGLSANLGLKTIQTGRQRPAIRLDGSQPFGKQAEILRSRHCGRDTSQLGF